MSEFSTWDLYFSLAFFLNLFLIHFLKILQFFQHGISFHSPERRVWWMEGSRINYIVLQGRKIDPFLSVLLD